MAGRINLFKFASVETANTIVELAESQGESALFWSIKNLHINSMVFTWSQDDMRHTQNVEMIILPEAFNAIVRAGTAIGESVAFCMVSIIYDGEYALSNYFFEFVLADINFLSLATYNQIIPSENPGFIGMSIPLFIASYDPEYIPQVSDFFNALNNWFIRNLDIECAHNVAHGSMPTPKAIEDERSSTSTFLAWMADGGHYYHLFLDDAWLLKDLTLPCLNACYYIEDDDLDAPLNILIKLILQSPDNIFSQFKNCEALECIASIMDVNSFRILITAARWRTQDENRDLNVDQNSRLISFLNNVIKRNISIYQKNTLAAQEELVEAIDGYAPYYAPHLQNLTDYFTRDYKDEMISNFITQPKLMLNLFAIAPAKRSGSHSAMRRLPKELMQEHLAPLLTF